MNDDQLESLLRSAASRNRKTGAGLDWKNRKSPARIRS